MNNVIPVTISARHMHLSEADAQTLFGADVALTPVPGSEGKKQYPAVERVAMHGPKASFPRVAVMLPLYKEFTQIEISLSDARAMGLEAPIRNSKDVVGSPGVKLVGPAGEVDIDQGVIVSRRHIHAPIEWAEERGLKHDQVVKLEIRSDIRSLIFDDVILRVEKGLSRAVAHIDVDEANAAGVSGACEGTVIY